MRLFWIVLLGVALGALGTSLIAPAEALELQVRGESDLALDPLLQGTRPIIKGRLTDNVHQGIPNAILTLTLHPLSARRGRRATSQRQLKTDGLGYFSETFQLKEGHYSLDVSFEKSGFYEHSATSATFHVQRWGLNLDLNTPKTVHFDPKGQLSIGIQASSKGLTKALPKGHSLKVQLLSSAGDLLGTQVLTSPHWSSTLKLPMSKLQGHTEPTLRVKFLADEYFDGAEDEASFFLFEAPQVELEGEVIRERSRRGIALMGSFQTANGPIKGVELVAEFLPDDERWHQAGKITTGKDGRFTAFIDQEDLPLGDIGFRVQLSPDAGKSFKSDTLTLELKPGGAMGWTPWVLLILLFGTIFSVGGYVALGQFGALLEKLLKRLRGHSFSPPSTRKRAPLTLPPPPERLPDHPHSIGGRVVDTLEGSFIEGVELSLIRKGEEIDVAAQKTQSAAGGVFSFDDLPKGKYILWARQRGYLSASVPLKIPHDGSMRYFALRFVPVRQRLQERYAWLLSHYAPGQELWGKETPSEVCAELLRRLNSSAVLKITKSDPSSDALSMRLRSTLESATQPLDELLNEVTHLLEEVYFSDRLYPESLLSMVELLFARLQEPLRGMERQRAKRRHAGTGQSRSAARFGVQPGRRT